MSDYPWFPMFFDISEKNVLVVGAGEVAGRRAATLTQFCAHVDVIGPRVSPTIESEVTAGRVTIYRRAFTMEDLDGRDMVLAATDDEALNAAIVAECRARGIPANASSDRSLCDFYFPGAVVDGNVAVGITASGKDHRRAREVTRRIRAVLKREED